MFCYLSIWASHPNQKKVAYQNTSGESEKPAAQASDSRVPIENNSSGKSQLSQKERYNNSVKKGKGKGKPRKNPKNKDFKNKFVQPSEDLFSNHDIEIESKNINLTVDCLKEFGRTKGLHKTYEFSTRFESKIIIEEQRIKREIVTDWKTGKTVRASLNIIGPKKYKITWPMLTWVVEYVVKFCIPIDRISKILSLKKKRFSSGRICGYLQLAAKILLPIYLYLAELLAESEVLYGDDSRCKTLEIKKKIEENILGTEDDKTHELVEKVSELLPRFSKVKNGERIKKQVSISTVIGKSDPFDCRSTIYFYRSHVGDLGNLFAHLLAMRRPRNRKIKLVTDLLAANKPDEWTAKKFEIEYFGCAAHARRPFYRYRERDPDLCYFMLRAFALLARVEDKIEDSGNTAKNIIYHRQKFSKIIWKIIHKKCLETISGKKWFPGSSLYDAAEYIIKHYIKLTKYLHNPEINPNNNISERVLRSDKIMQVSSKFRVTEKGRVIIDILRTIIMTCSAAEVSVKSYLLYVFKNSTDASKNPQNYTPFAFAKRSIEKNDLKSA